jgi:SAM-dependent methyltransferase
MGLDIRTAEFLLHCRRLGVDFSSTCTLGRQSNCLIPSGRALVKAWTGLDMRGMEFADDFLRTLGAKECYALDSSPYEGAEFIHNLNAPLPASLLGRFNCVIDGGTLEHIFDFSSALRNVLKMVKPGGHLIICNIANNFLGHGFYQLSPELFYSALTPENGCEIASILLSENSVWYEAGNPGILGERVEAITRNETYIYVCAKRISDCEPFARAPHQSDYCNSMSAAEDATSIHVASSPQTLRQTIVRRCPFLTDVWKVLRSFKASLYPRFPLLEEMDCRWRIWKGKRARSLRNARLFRRIGRRLPLKPE